MTSRGRPAGRELNDQITIRISKSDKLKFDLWLKKVGKGSGEMIRGWIREHTEETF